MKKCPHCAKKDLPDDVDTCSHCGMSVRICPDCEGSGHTRAKRWRATRGGKAFDQTASSKCPACRGTGYL